MSIKNYVLKHFYVCILDYICNSAGKSRRTMNESNFPLDIDHLHEYSSFSQYTTEKSDAVITSPCGLHLIFKQKIRELLEMTSK